MTALAAVVWLIWLFAPSSTWSIRLSREPIVWLGFGLVYGALLVAAAVDGLPDGAGFGSVEEVMRVFDSEWATLAGWAHYLAFDLFVGGWMLRDAPGGRHRLFFPLILTAIVAPIGLFVYLVGRQWFRRVDGREL
ncbi:MAG: ABA4-like family protein [Acidimicrobiia bacterium]|nr:ABA4-like family protein [Acidimicrobiia bacterium]